MVPLSSSKISIKVLTVKGSSATKDFLIQFGLKDLSELPNVEDFEDLASGI